MKNTLFLIAFLCHTLLSFSQGWERFYGSPDQLERISDAALTSDGGYFLVGSIGVGDTAFIMKTSPDGMEEWTHVLGTGTPSVILRNANGEYFVSGTINAEGDQVNLGLDALGNVIWENESFGPDPSLWTVTTDGYVCFFMGGPDVVERWKIDFTGDLVWEDTVSIPGLIPGGRLTGTSDGGFAIAGTSAGDILLTKFNSDGDLVWTVNDGSPENESGNVRITSTADGGFAVVADLTGTDNLPGMHKFSATGELEWWNVFDPAGTDVHYVNSIIETSDGSIVLTGRSNGLQDRAYFLKYTAAGVFEFLRYYGSTAIDSWFNRVLETPEGNYFAAGYGFSLANNGDGYAILTTPDGVLYSNYIRGNVAHDIDNDCDLTATDQPLQGWHVLAEGGLTYYSVTDENGFYNIGLDTGEYTLEIFPPSSYWAPCENPVNVNFQSTFDTIVLDFPVQAAIECPALQVDIATGFLRKCFDNNIAVSYCNLGTTIAVDAYVEITLDSLLSFVGSAIPPSGQTGNTYTFPLGDLPVNACGTFNLTVFVDCEAEIGQVQCLDAHIFPDTICSTPMNWAGASMLAKAKCDGDTAVILQLENVGVAPTSQPIEYMVIEDQIIFSQGAQHFEPAELVSFTYSADGATWRIKSDQEPGHPGFSLPTAFAEGCGTNNAGTFSTGFVNEHPLNDGDGFVDLDCYPVVASFDPNDKAAFPQGYDEPHYIDPDTDLEYRIRFQNTGTDTAFNIVIRDTLSPLLNPATLRPGAASHPYEFEWSGNGVPVFRFPNIMLPDSNVNEMLSHGFVNFKISQQPNLPPGSVIFNSAAIYFDFNEPVITNEVFHTIGEDFILVAVDEVEDPAAARVNVYPNPFIESATFEVESDDYQQLTLNVCDGLGRRIHRSDFTGNRLEFHRGTLRAGVYFFTIESENGVVSSGKLVVVHR